MSDTPLHATFTDTMLDARLQWHCEPAHWQVDYAANCLRLHTDAGTDFWQRTHYGFQVDNGHYSDWSTQSLPKHIDTVWFRIRAEANDCIVESSLEGEQWTQIRMAHLHERAGADTVACGLYACSPKDAGYQAEFAFLSFIPGRL